MEDSKALVALLGVLLGIVLGKGIEAAVEKRRRWNRETDMVFALHAEIAASRSALIDQCSQRYRDAFLAEPLPAGPAGAANFVFQSLKGDFTLLPQDVIHQIVLYYRLAEESDLLLAYLAQSAYAALDDARKREFRSHTMRSFEDQLRAADEALDTLKACIERRHFTPPGLSRVDSDATKGWAPEAMSDEGADGTNHHRSP